HPVQVGDERHAVLELEPERSHHERERRIQELVEGERRRRGRLERVEEGGERRGHEAGIAEGRLEARAEGLVVLQKGGGGALRPRAREQARDAVEALELAALGGGLEEGCRALVRGERARL